MSGRLETEKKDDRKAIAALKDEEIAVTLTRLRERLHTLRTQSVTEKVEDVSQFGKVRRDIARLLTEQKRRSSAAG